MQPNVYDVMCNFFHYYLTECSVEKTLAMIADEFFFVSCGGKDFLLTKEESKVRLIHDFEQRKNNQICFSVNKYRQVKGNEQTYLCWGKLTIQSSTQVTRLEPLTMMVTLGVRLENDDYKVFFLQQEKIKDEQNGPQTLFAKQNEKVLQQAVQNYMPGNKLGIYWEESLPFGVVNQKMLDMLGYTYEELLRASEGLLENIIHPEDYPKLWQTMEDAFQKNKEYQKVHRIRRKDGNYLWVYNTGKKQLIEENRPVVTSTMLDISQNPFFIEQRQDEVNRDYLTGLYNRRYARSIINEQLALGIPYGLLLFDINNFRQINELYGHNMGDEVLILLGKILQKYTRDGDVCVRLGADEYLAFLPNFDNGMVLKGRAEQINAEFKKYLQELCPQNQSKGLTISGVHGRKETTLEELYRETSRVLYQLKENNDETDKIQITESRIETN